MRGSEDLTGAGRGELATVSIENRRIICFFFSKLQSAPGAIRKGAKGLFSLYFPPLARSCRGGYNRDKILGT